MQKYLVTVLEVHSQDVIVEANSQEEAQLKAYEGEGVNMLDSVYQYTLDDYPSFSVNPIFGSSSNANN